MLGCFRPLFIVAVRWRLLNYFEPRVPDGCFVNIVTDALGLPPVGTPVLVGCAMFALPAEPWFAGFEPLPGWFFGFIGFPNAIVFPPSYTGILRWTDA